MCIKKITQMKCLTTILMGEEPQALRLISVPRA